ncbi:MAG: hypothetical protein MZU97_00995 [Bacillus subtilis]|nr:hypothetical protein [Bacillus subtilis]
MPNALAKAGGFADCLYLDPADPYEDRRRRRRELLRDHQRRRLRHAEIDPRSCRRSRNYRFCINRERTSSHECSRNARCLRRPDSDELAEAATCGTAAIITPIGTIEDHGRTITFGVPGQAGPMTKRIYDVLTGIQFGDIEPPHGWIHIIE